MARPRLRAALLAGAVLAAGAPVVASATSTHLSCGVSQSGRWERIPVEAFRPVNGLAAQDAVTAYTVDEQSSQQVAATNGVLIQVSTSHGCRWSDSYALSPAPTAAQPFAGLGAKVVSLGLMGGRRLAAVQEGAGSASRPHVMVQVPGAAWTTSDNGLPVQGAPRLLRTAGDGRTAYLTVSPTANGGSDSGATSGLVPGLPGPGSGGTPTGLLYATTDGGASWSLRTGATDLPSGGTGFTALDVDQSDANRLYGIVDGQLLVSRNGGASFTSAGTGFSAVTAMGPLSVAAFRSAGGGVFSGDGGVSFNSFSAPAGITSAAFRTGDSALVVESNGVLRRLEPNNGKVTAVPAGVPARAGSLLGDRGDGASFHALAGHALLRYVDPVEPGATAPPPAVGDLSVPPPRPGAVLPAVRNVSLPVGSSAVEDFTLALPKNPTPLDLFFLVDVSGSMKDYITNLQGNINGIVRQLTSSRVDLRVGVGELGTGPAYGENEYPPAYVFPPQRCPSCPGGFKPGPTYVKPRVYRRIRAIGSTGPELQRTVDSIRIETDDVPRGCTPCPAREGALLALEQVATGHGIQTEQEHRLHAATFSAVAPGQQANWRNQADVRKVIVLATDEAFDIPYDTPQKPGSTLDDYHPDFTRTLKILRDRQIQVIGLSAGNPASLDDLRTVASGTGALAPPGGLRCGGDPPEDVVAGGPLVCNNGDHFSDAIVRLLQSLVDRQRVSLVPARRSPVLGFLDGSRLASVDVKKPTRTGFSVRVSCVDVKPGRYAADVNAVLRQTTVGTARLNVTCVAAAAAVRPRPVQAVGNPPPPPPQPVANVVVPVAPPAPAAQPQVNPQVQSQVQVQPLTAGALQEQQELQLALALNGTLKDDDPVFNAGTQLAMVDRRRREEVQALGVLAFAMLACSGLGLARLRSRPEVQVRRAR